MYYNFFQPQETVSRLQLFVKKLQLAMNLFVNSKRRGDLLMAKQAWYDAYIICNLLIERVSSMILESGGILPPNQFEIPMDEQPERVIDCCLSVISANIMNNFIIMHGAALNAVYRVCAQLLKKLAQKLGETDHLYTEDSDAAYTLVRLSEIPFAITN